MINNTPTNPSLRDASAWVPACGGTEQPFKVKGVRLHYMWNQLTGQHAYYNLDSDMFLSNEEADQLLSR